MDALIGWTGFVGSTLKNQRTFDHQFRSTDISRICGMSFDTVVCAGVPAQKWVADADPTKDRANIQALAGHLSHVQARRFILISTVDVFADSRGATEATSVPPLAGSPYGANRRWLENFVAEYFEQPLIVRLPALVGPGLRKNAAFDFLNGNNLHALDARSVYQFYPIVNLWTDMLIALRAGLDLVHLTSEPVSLAQVAREAFGIQFAVEHATKMPAHYNLLSGYAELFGGHAPYTYSQRESLLALRAYAQSEHVTPMHSE